MCSLGTMNMQNVAFSRCVQYASSIVFVTIPNIQSLRSLIIMLSKDAGDLPLARKIWDSASHLAMDSDWYSRLSIVSFPQAVIFT